MTNENRAESVRSDRGEQGEARTGTTRVKALAGMLASERQTVERLERFIRLERRAEAASDRKEFTFIVLNDTVAVVPYTQAAIWTKAEGEAGSLAGLSGVDEPARRGPFPQWLTSFLSRFAEAHPAPVQADGAEAAPRVMPFTVSDTAFADARDREMARDYLPPYGLWAEWVMPTDPGHPPIRASLVLWRQEPWTKDDGLILTKISESYAHTWGAFKAGRRDWFGVSVAKEGVRNLRKLFKERRVKIGAAAALVLVLLFPVRQSVLAPAEIVPDTPFVVRSPLQGVVDEIAVRPNQVIKKGDVIVRMESRDLKDRLQAAEQSLAVARAQLLQGQQAAFSDDRSKMELGVLTRREEQAAAELDFLKQEFARTEIRSDRDGVAIFSDPQEWSGKSVATGERIMMIASPKSHVLEAEIPIADAVELEPGADVRFFQHAAPASPIHASLTSVAYRSSPAADSSLAYRARAEIDKDTDASKLTVGQRGTAKFYGKRTPLVIYVLRRPLAALRLWLGI